jgi:hypothetical protein
MKSESEVKTDILLAGPDIVGPGVGVILLRNNRGVLQDKHENYVSYGVGGNGGSDYLGWGVGERLAGVFVAVETKREGWKPPSETAKGEDAVRYRKQLAFINAVKLAGGIACFATSVQDVRDAITAWLRDR